MFPANLQILLVSLEQGPLTTHPLLFSQTRQEQTGAKKKTKQLAVQGKGAPAANVVSGAPPPSALGNPPFWPQFCVLGDRAYMISPFLVFPLAKSTFHYTPYGRSRAGAPGRAGGTLPVAACARALGRAGDGAFLLGGFVVPWILLSFNYYFSLVIFPLVF